MALIPISNARQKTINVDFTVKLPESIGFNVVIIVVDSVFKRAHFISTHISHIHPNISNLFNHIMNNASLTSNPLRISVKKSIFLSYLLILFWYRSTQFLLMSNHSINDHMVPYDLNGTLNSISKNFSVLKAIIYILQFLDSLNTSI